jgi:hypothetical protein
MNTEKFNELLKLVTDEIHSRLGSKAGEYAKNNNRLHNFYKAADTRETYPEDALQGMKIKHSVSIDDLVKDLKNNGDSVQWTVWWEKIIDEINYDILLLGLIDDRLNKELKIMQPIEPIEPIEPIKPIKIDYNWQKSNKKKIKSKK